MKEYKIKSFEDFVNHIGKYYNNKSIRLYRGQQDDLPLNPKLLRLVNINGRIDEFYNIEKRVINEFKKLACTCDAKIKDFNDWDTLAISQHFGLPTRLLDWTSNPLAALWFAFESEKNNKDDRLVWGLVVEDELLIDIEKDNPFNLRFTKVFKPKYIDARLNAQNSWFSIHNVNFHGKGGDGLPHFNEVDSINELEEFEGHLARFLIPNCLILLYDYKKTFFEISEFVQKPIISYSTTASSYSQVIYLVNI